MPYINTKVSNTLTKEQEIKLKVKLGEAIALFPGKTEKWLMLNFEDNARLWLGGDATKPSAFVEVWILGAPNSDAYGEMTAFICDAIEEICGISGDRIYVKYGETPSWGFDGSNF